MSLGYTLMKQKENGADFIEPAPSEYNIYSITVIMVSMVRYCSFSYCIRNFNENDSSVNRM